ncbi:hypothetical protein [Nocardia sp. NPDC024068]|uniref:hypothetical protein n=1 Tax=Nocardia sp. NPDC024068 TaxID=3157197 RepID=UPI0033D376FB
MTTRSAARFAAVTALCAGTMLFAACADTGTGTATTSAAPVSQAAPPAETPQQRSLRIRDQLVRLGCDSNSCIQTYFACEDGVVSGDACEFYRRHPLN